MTGRSGIDCGGTRSLPIARPAFLSRLDRRLVTYGGGTLVILALLGTVGFLIRPDPKIDGVNFYTPGMTPTREDCVLAKMKSYARLDKQVMQTIAMECELTVQSIEGHEKLRKEWEQRQAAREAAPKPSEPAAPTEGDRLRRVWR